MLGRVPAAHLGRGSAAPGRREAGLRPFGAQNGARPKEGRQPDIARLGRKETRCAKQKRPDLDP